jgi:VWFA-related protein
MKILKFTFVLFLFSIPALAQTSKPTPPPENGDEVVKVSTDLVQIDAVVTDKQGNQVTNLTANDFELLQDGKPQTITNLSYVNREISRQNQTTVLKTDKNSPLPPPGVSSSAASGRVLTFVVDDGNCEVSRVGMKAAQEGLEKFIMEQMLPNDLVAIYQTRRGSSMLQQYMSDKARLLQTVRRIRWYPPDGICSTTGDYYKQERNDSTLKSEGIQSFKSDTDRAREEAADNYNRDKQTTGLIGVMRYAINGLRQIGGRKLLFLMSDALPISNGKGTMFNSFYGVRDLMEMANRASVVINPIDVRGLIAPGADAADDFGIKADMFAVEKAVESRQFSDNSRQSGLAYAANETGGKFYRNMNSLDYPIQEVLKLERGYYLIAYQPDEETFKGKKFHKIEIKLKRPDLSVNSRSGFNGVTDKEITPKPRNGDSELYESLISPLPNAGLDLQLTAFFANTTVKGNFVQTSLHIDGKEISFASNSDATQKAVFDVIAVTLDEKNKPVDEFNRTYTVKIPKANLPTIQQNGLIFSADIPIKKAGVYSYRIAVRDVNSKMIGSAGQQIEVPNLKKNKIFLSGLTLGEVILQDGKPLTPSANKTEEGFAPVTKRSIPAIRQFTPGTILGYSYQIYNAVQHKLTVQIRLYNNGKVILDNAPQPIHPEASTDSSRINDYAYMRLPPTIAPGDYALQIIIRDLQSNETTSQWIDFEVVK